MSHSDFRHAGVFQIIVLLKMMAGHSPLGYSGTEFMVPLITMSHPDPKTAKEPQTMTLPPPCLTVGIMLFL